MTRLFLPLRSASAGIQNDSSRRRSSSGAVFRIRHKAHSCRDVLEAGLDLCIGTPRQVTAFDLQPGRNLLLGQARLYPAPPDIVPDGGLPFDFLVQTMHGLSYLMT